jgi:hypothetical protein
MFNAQDEIVAIEIRQGNGRTLTGRRMGTLRSRS